MARSMQDLIFPDLASLLARRHPDVRHPYVETFEQTLDDLQPGLSHDLGAVLYAPPEVGQRALSYLLTLACEAQNGLNIALGRAAIVAMPRAWVLATIEIPMHAMLLSQDAWPWRRFLELAWKLDLDLVARVARMGLSSTDEEIREVCEEALEEL
jgi:hypothetical protein